MRPTWTAWVLSGLLASTGGAWAQTADGEAHTITRDEVRTWTTNIDGKEYEVRPATPAYDGDTGLFRLSSAYTLPKGGVAFSVFRDNYDRDPKDIDASVHGVNLAIGATSRLELFTSIGLQNRLDTDALFQPGFANEYPFAGTQVDSPGWQTGFGDVKLGAKFKLLDDYLGDPVALAIKGWVKLPTADEAKGLGTGKVSVGGDLILSKTLNHGADIHASIGFVSNSDPEGINIGNALRWGFGLTAPSCRYFQLQAEVVGTNYSGDDDFPQTNPIDVVVGPVFWIKPGIFIRPAVSWNLNFDDRGLNSASRTYTGKQISIGFHPGTACCEIGEQRQPDAPVNRPPTVACEIEPSQLLPGERARCRATGSDPDGDALAYTWTASAGSITGSGTEATFDSTGVASGTDVTITVTAADGKGGTADATCPVRVYKPKDVVHTYDCTSGGFPRNLSRLNNVDKACLDDVASRMRSDRGGRLIITGHADSRERHPEVIARKRAEAVKDYLVTERGVDPSRISTKSAAANRPLDTGTTAAARAKNRRVKVLFVPTGARAPEYDD